MIDAKIVLSLLDNTPLFRGIPQSILAPLIKQSMQMSLMRGERLLSPGILNEDVYVLISGQLSVHLTPSSVNEPVATLKAGDCVGEMSVLVDRKVSAYVTAAEDSQLLVIGYSAFWKLIKESIDAAHNVLSILVHRIRAGNALMTDALLRNEIASRSNSDS